MVSDATGHERKFNTLLVWKLSRFSRNNYDSIVYQAMLEERGVQLISITEPIDNSPAGRLVRAVIQSINAFYSENLGEEVRRGLRKLVMRKFYPHRNAPYGLKLEKVREEGDEVYHSRFVLNPPYDQIVRRLFLESIAGRSDTDIRDGLFADGIPSPTGKEKWPTSTIDTMVTNKTYASYIVWGIHSKSGDEPLEVPDCHPGIVTLEEFELAQQSRASRTRQATHPRQAGSKHMASGLLKCRKCGKNLQVRPNQDPDPSYYICKTRRREGIAVCSCPNLLRPGLRAAAPESRDGRHPLAQQHENQHRSHIQGIRGPLRGAGSETGPDRRRTEKAGQAAGPGHDGLRVRSLHGGGLLQQDGPPAKI